MKHSIIIVFLFSAFLTSLSCTDKKTPAPEFSLHLFMEPQQLDPAIQRSSSASYFFLTVMRGLYKYDDRKGLIPEGGRCQWQNNLRLKCSISKNHLWADQKPVTSENYRLAFQHLLNPDVAAPRADLLFSLKNGKEYFQGKVDKDKLGFKILSSSEFELEFSQQDPYFLIKLTSTALFPKRADNPTLIDDYKKFVGTGPYQIDQWESGQWMRLKPNPHFASGHPARPDVRFYFIDNELTALRLYEKGRLDFLRRLPSKLIKQFSNRDDFLQVPMARFDYIGFGPRLIQRPKIREALAKAINYDEFKILVSGLERPGCPSISATWMDHQPCYDTDVKAAKKVWQQAGGLDARLTFAFSKLGGDDIQKQAEWLEQQWKNKLGMKLNLQPTEQKSFLNQLRTNPPDIFRKGVGVDLPTCLTALETFAPDSRQNYGKFKDADFSRVLQDLRKEKQASRRLVLCRKGVERLLARFWIIPLGEMHFSILANDRFQGWTINSINQLDLSQLHFSMVSKK